MPSFYQDRLGTNILAGKALQKRDACFLIGGIENCGMSRAVSEMLLSAPSQQVSKRYLLSVFI